MGTFDYESGSRKERADSSFAQDVGGLLKDVFNGTRQAVTDTIKSMLSPSSWARDAAKAVAQPVTSAVDAWVVGEPLQDAWERFVERQFDARESKLIGQIDSATSRAVDIITSPIDYVMQALPGDEGINDIKFNFALEPMKITAKEFAKEVYDDIRGNKTVHPAPASAPKPPPPSPYSRNRNRRTKRQVDRSKKQRVIYN